VSIFEEQKKLYNAFEFQKIIENENKKLGNENCQYELINGQIYMMSSPNEMHHDLSKFIEKYLDNYFENSGCKVYHAPFDLFLFDKKHFALLTSDKSTCKDVYVPDIMVVCDKDKRREDGVHGAPDLVVEIVSKSSIRIDYQEKLFAYMNFGVKEYWVVDPMKQKIMVFTQSDDGSLSTYNYTFDDTLMSELYDGLHIDFHKFTII